MIGSGIRVVLRARVLSSLHCVLAFLMASVASALSPAQGDADTSAQTAAKAAQTMPEVLDRQDVLRRISIYEDVARNADSLHLDHQLKTKVFRNLGILYDMAGMMPKAEAATQRAIELMKDGPQDQLADEYNNLSSIHALVGNLRQAEKDQTQALAVREKIGDPLGIALTWTDMAALYSQERHYKKAMEYAQKSYDMLKDRTDMKPSNHIAVLQTMSFALCGTKQCSQAIPIMTRALDESKKAFGPESLSAAAQGFALGYVYWHSGDNDDAGEWMRRSLIRMKQDLGWGAPVYVNAVEQYARFLHQTGQRELASNAESEVHQIKSIVDARTMTTRGGEFLSSRTR